jgi:hypothetical protein
VVSGKSSGCGSRPFVNYTGRFTGRKQHPECCFVYFGAIAGSPGDFFLCSPYRAAVAFVVPSQVGRAEPRLYPVPRKAVTFTADDSRRASR